MSILEKLASEITKNDWD